MTQVKICGITTRADALHAIACGADALGFNFYPKSPRFVSVEAAREIISSLPYKVRNVGIFVDEDAKSITKTAIDAQLDMVQLHGGETPEYVDTLVKILNRPIIKAFRVGGQFSVREIEAFDVEGGILLDGFTPGLHGGTGATFDWTVAAEVAAVAANLYLAGGLSIDNVAQAIRAVRPFAVDACSYLETEPGRKDPDKVKLFIDAAKGAI